MGRAIVVVLVLGSLGGCVGQTVGDSASAQQLAAEVRRVCGKEIALDLAQAVAVNLSPLHGNLIRAAHQLCPQLPGTR
jgi:hypothetical protein